MSNFMKICPVGAELFQEDGRTDMTKLIVVFFQFSGRAPENTSIEYLRTSCYITFCVNLHMYEMHFVLWICVCLHELLSR
jgi:hypothetical protein